MKRLVSVRFFYIKRPINVESHMYHLSLLVPKFKRFFLQKFLLEPKQMVILKQILFFGRSLQIMPKKNSTLENHLDMLIFSNL